MHGAGAHDWPWASKKASLQRCSCLPAVTAVPLPERLPGKPCDAPMCWGWRTAKVAILNDRSGCSGKSQAMAWADLRHGWEGLSESCTPQDDLVTCSTIQRRRVQSDCALPPFPHVAQESCGAELGPFGVQPLATRCLAKRKVGQCQQSVRPSSSSLGAGGGQAGEHCKELWRME